MGTLGSWARNLCISILEFKFFTDFAEKINLSGFMYFYIRI